MTLLWRLLADWCLTYEGGTSVLYGWWLTEGDNCWGYIDGENGPWVTGRGWLQ